MRMAIRNGRMQKSHCQRAMALLSLDRFAALLSLTCKEAPFGSSKPSKTSNSAVPGTAKHTAGVTPAELARTINNMEGERDGP
jgi:hypothetical protein